MTLELVKSRLRLEKSRFTLVKAAPRLRLVKWGDSWEDQDRDEQGRWTTGGGGPSTSEVATQIISDARAAEPATSASLRDISANNGGTMVGLDHAVKGQDSLERKISEKQDEAAQVGVKLSPSEAGGKIFDDLRYTMTFPADKYTEGVKGAVADLKAQGYTFDQDRVKNTWESPVYRGLNTTARTPDGKAFELQFHTPESFDLKENIQHPLYEEARLTTTSPERVDELNSQMAAHAAAMGPSPPGVSELTPEVFG